MQVNKFGIFAIQILNYVLTSRNNSDIIYLSNTRRRKNPSDLLIKLHYTLKITKCQQKEVKPMTALARNLKRSRENANIYQAELGNRVGVSQTQIAHYESGKKIPSVVTLERIATELEVSVDYLLGRSA